LADRDADEGDARTVGLGVGHLSVSAFFAVGASAAIPLAFASSGTASWREGREPPTAFSLAPAPLAAVGCGGTDLDWPRLADVDYVWRLSVARDTDRSGSHHGGVTVMLQEPNIESAKFFGGIGDLAIGVSSELRGHAARRATAEFRNEKSRQKTKGLRHEVDADHYGGGRGRRGGHGSAL
jgi:hypothetical protein